MGSGGGAGTSRSPRRWLARGFAGLEARAQEAAPSMRVFEQLYRIGPLNCRAPPDSCCGQPGLMNFHGVGLWALGAGGLTAADQRSMDNQSHAITRGSLVQVLQLLVADQSVSTDVLTGLDRSSTADQSKGPFCPFANIPIFG